MFGVELRTGHRRWFARFAMAIAIAALLALIEVSPAQASTLGPVPLTWAVSPSPNPMVGTGYDLNGISCLSDSHCFAVGNSAIGFNPQTLVESWDGSTWTVSPSPSPSATQNYLRGVSCLSDTSCVADGYYGGATNYETLVETWDGTSWSVVPSPNPDGSSGSSLAAISCVSATSCTAVGNATIGSTPQSLIETWDGSV